MGRSLVLIFIGFFSLSLFAKDMDVSWPDGHYKLIYNSRGLILKTGNADTKNSR